MGHLGQSPWRRGRFELLWRRSFMEVPLLRLRIDDRSYGILGSKMTIKHQIRQEVGLRWKGKGGKPRNGAIEMRISSIAGQSNNCLVNCNKLFILTKSAYTVVISLRTQVTNLKTQVQNPNDQMMVVQLVKNKRNTGKQAFDIIRDKAAAARVVSEALARAVLDFEQEYLRFIVH